MRSNLEHELKLRPAPDSGAMPLEGREIPERVLMSTYYDTTDLRLAGAGITLRRRTGAGRDPSWQLKLPGGGPRLELEWPAPTEAVPLEVRRLLTAHTRGRPLSAVATLRTRRSGVVVDEDGVGVAEVVRDSVDVIDAGRSVRSFEELEAELVDGDPKVLRRIEQRLLEAGATEADGRPKLLQALDLEPPRRPLGGNGRRARLRAALQEQYREVLLNDPRTRMGDDPDALHDHRVAVRRLRAMLRAGRPLLDRQWADALRGSLKQAGGALAEVRDLDVLTEQLRNDAEELSGRERDGSRRVVHAFQESRDRAQIELAGALESSWYVSLLNRLEHAVEEPRFAGSGSVKKATIREHRRASRMARRLPEHPSDRDLHELRKAVKKARYAAELAAAMGSGGTGKYLKQAKRVQDVLGDHQDAVVAAHALEDVRPGLPGRGAERAVTALIECQAGRMAEARAALPKAWKRFDERGRRLKRTMR